MPDDIAPGFEASNVIAPPIMTAIVERVHSRQEKWPSTAVPTLPHPFDLTERTILGSFSYALQESHKRLLKADSLISVNHAADTPPALARDYLTLRFGKAAKITRPQLQRVSQHTRDLPLLVKPMQFSEGYYLDVRGAYWSILQVVSWQVDYNPGRWLLAGPPMDDFPWQEDKRTHKLARVAMVTAGDTGPLPVWDPKTHSQEPMEVGNRLVNSQMKGLVRDVLHALGYNARRMGATYIATDGYICPEYRVLDRIRSMVADWGLTARVKGGGPGAVYGPGSYIVGELRSKAAVKGAIDNLRKGDYDKWLQPRFAKLAARRPPRFA